MKLKLFLKSLVTIVLLFWGYQVIFAVNPIFEPLFSSILPESEQTERIITADTLRKGENSRIVASSTIVIPIRQGFPFCETFIGFAPRPNAVWNGTLMGGAVNTNVKLTGQALQLTSNGNSENGYVFVDIPFSSKFGLKVSFEFSAFGGRPGSNGLRADGFSFFMFDGSIDAGSFGIGGTGGALGYTAVRDRFNENSLLSPGLKGAYLGLGFDELGNFGNSFVGKYGGIENPSNNPDGPVRPIFSHSVILRGPVAGSGLHRNRDRENAFITLGGPRYDSYKFIDAVIFDPDPKINPNGYVESDFPSFFHPKRFKLDTDAFAQDCNDEGYRKVFIDLKPFGTGYKLKVQLLITDANLGLTLINVFEGRHNADPEGYIDYNFPAPELLKVGFAAATGDGTNFHHIRNVTVQVSNTNLLQLPIVKKIEEKICENDTNTFELDVTLQNDVGNSFIRCLQLYKSETDANNVVINNTIQIPFPSGSNPGPPASFCPTGNCVDLLCRPERAYLDAFDSNGLKAGKFEVFLVDEAGVEVPKVRFIPQQSFSGKTTVWFTVTDNFGKVSLPKPITIEVIPLPEIVINTVGPLTWEKQEEIAGKIRVELNATITNNNPAFSYTYQWFKDGVAIVGANNPKYVATERGKYTVEIKTSQNCTDRSKETEIKVIENLNPAIPVTPSPETCKELGSVTVNISSIAVTGFKSDGSAGNEKWRLINATSSATVIDWQFLPKGATQIKIDNTTFPGNLLAGNYILQIGDEYRSGQPDSNGNPLYRHVLTFTIGPKNPLIISNVTPINELCFGDGGTVEVEASGGDGNLKFELLNKTNGSPISTYSLSGGKATFSNVPQGSYDVIVKSETRCEARSTVTIGGPTAALNITEVSKDEISCGITDSGRIKWQVTGGTGPYTLFAIKKNGGVVPSPTFTQSAGDFEFTKLEAGSYVLEVKDKNNCTITSSAVVLTTLPLPVFSVVPPQVCEGEAAILVPKLDVLSNSVPVFSWFNPEGTEITADGTINGIKYTFKDDGNPATPKELWVEGLAVGSFEFTLKISGANVCTQSDQKVKITVSPLPKVKNVKITNLSCLNSRDGKLEVELDPALNVADFEFELKDPSGGTTKQSSNIFDQLPAGNYEVTVINKATGCITVEKNKLITQPDLLEIRNSLPEDPTCSEKNGEIKFTVIGGTAPYTVKLNGRNLTDFDHTVSSTHDYSIQKLAADAYSIEVLDQNNCTVNSSLTLVNDPLDPITVAPMSLEICEGTDGLITPVVTTPGSYTLSWFKDASATLPILNSTVPDANGFTYSIDPVTSSLTVIGLKEGNHSFYLLVEGPDLCSPPPIEAKIKVFPPLSFTYTVKDVQCFAANDGEILVNAVGGNGNYEYSLNSGPFVTNPRFSNLAPSDIYTVEVRSVGINGCTFQLKDIKVKTPIADISVNTPLIEKSSCNGPNGNIKNLVISGGWGNYTVEWRQGSLTGPLVSGDLTGASNLLEDTYFLIVKDDKGCERNFNFRVEDKPDPIFTVAYVEVCEKDGVVLSPVNSVASAASSTLNWYKDAAKTQPITNGTDPTDPTVSYTIDPANGKLTVIGLKGSRALYSYYLHVVCTDVVVKADFLVRADPLVDFNIKNVSCKGGADGKISIASGGDPFYTYSVNGGSPLTQAQLEARTFAKGTYNITVKNEGFCDKIFTEVVEDPAFTLEVDPLRIKVAPSCGSNIGVINTSIKGGWAPYEVTVYKDGLVLSIISNVTGSDFEQINLAPGDYNLKVRDKEGCEVRSTTINLQYGPTQITVPDVIICEGEPAVFTATLNPVATGVVNYEWYKDAGLTQRILSSVTPDANGITYQIDPNGTLRVDGLKSNNSPTTYHLKVTGGSSCPGFTATPRVRINRLPVLSGTTENVICFNGGSGKGKVSLTGAAGDGIFSYSINGTDYDSKGDFEVAPGNYTGYVKSGAGCVVTIPNLVVKGPASDLEIKGLTKTEPSCNASDGSIRFEIVGGYTSDDYTIEIFKNGTLLKTDIVSSGSYSLLNISSGDYDIKVKDFGNCSVAISNYSIVDLTTPLSVTNDVICFGEEAVLTPSTTQVSGTPVYTWYFDAAGLNPITNGNIAGVTYTISSNGELRITGLAGSTQTYKYYVKISGAGICGNTQKTSEVKVYGLPNLKIQNPVKVCDPKIFVDLTKSIDGYNPSAYDYEILNPAGNLMTQAEFKNVAIGGNYQVRSSEKGAKCWNNWERIFVQIAKQELIPYFEYQADMGGGNFFPNSDVQLFEAVKFDNYSKGDIVDWQWDFGDGTKSNLKNPTHIYNSVGKYTVILKTTDSIGCVAETQRLIVVSNIVRVEFPNAFTPEATQNNYFRPIFRGIRSIEVFIFSAWGELIYHSDTMQDMGWDGKFNGVPAIPGNYVYRGVYVTNLGERGEKLGKFTLFR